MNIHVRTRVGFASVLAIIILAVMLSVNGCAAVSAEHPTPPTSVSATAPAVYTVQFMVEDEVLTVKVPEGTYISTEPTVPEGMVVSEWLSETGSHADPMANPVSRDVIYTAVLFPDFYRHIPYLFADENGFIHPDDILTGGELTAALQALAPTEETLANRTMPEPEALVTKELLFSCLEGLFPSERLENALTYVQEGEISRAAFAGFMNILLDRNNGEKLRVDAGQTLPRDLPLDDADASDILEATISHTKTDDGLCVLDAVLAMQWRPGFTLIQGTLYYADENGTLLRDQQFGTLSFGPDGKYTSGDTELDSYVTELLWSFIQEDPAADRYDILYTAFRYCRNEFNYVNRGYLDYGATGWEVEWAKAMFESGAGNCYSYAAAFCALARGLGYDAHCISGLVLELSRPHGWCEFEVDGENFFFDPQLARADMLGERDNWGEDMFAIPMWDTWSWRYIWEEG